MNSIYKPASNFIIKGLTLLLVFCTLVSSQLTDVGFSFSGMDIFFYILFLLIVFYRYNTKSELAIFLSPKSAFFFFFLLAITSSVYSQYVISFKWAIYGIILVCIIPFSIKVFDKIVFTSLQIKKILKLICVVGFILIYSLFYEHFTSGIGKNILFIRGVQGWFKDGGLAATFINITLISALSMYALVKKRIYIYLFVLCMLTLISLLYIKSIILSVLILLFYFRTFTKGKRNFLLIFAGISILIWGVVNFLPMVTAKFLDYQILYVGNETREEMPRNVLYLTSMEIAKNKFPLGSGPGTFGSYPVMKTYNKIYEDYGISGIYGLGKPEPQRASFLLDAYWSSILGELGFIGLILYLFFFTVPFRKLIRINTKNESTILKLFVMCVTMVIFIESFALAIPSQINMVVILCIVCQGIANYVVRINSMFQ